MGVNSAVRDADEDIKMSRTVKNSLIGWRKSALFINLILPQNMIAAGVS